MPRIIPIRYMRNTAKLSEMCNQSDEPIFITKNGYGDMVVMSMATYEQQLARMELHTKIMEGKAQADRGELLDGPSALAGMREKYAK